MKLARKLSSILIGALISVQFVAITAGPASAAPAQTGTWTAVASSADGTKLVAGDFFGGIWTSTDSGVNWVSRAANSGNRQWIGITSSADGVKVAAVVRDGGIWTSADSGVTWTDRTTASGGVKNWSAIASSSDGSKLVATVACVVVSASCTATGEIWTSTDSGVNWTRRVSAIADGLYGVASSSDGQKLAATYLGGIYLSADGGQNWTTTGSTITQPSSDNYFGIASSADGTKLAAAVYGNNTSGPVIVSSDSGATWTRSTVSGAQRFMSIAASADGAKLVSGTYGGKIYTSADSGATWVDRSLGDFPAPNNGYWRFASSSDGHKLVGILEGGCIYTSSDAGASWINRCNAESAPTAPGKPVGVPGNGSVSLSWSKPTGGTGPMTYTVASSPAGASCVVTDRTALCTGLTNGSSYTFTVSATNPVGTGPASVASDPIVPNIPPTVSSVSPTSGASTGGTAITITGTLFAAGATVKVGTAACTSVVVVSSTQITCVTPAGALTRDIAVTNANGTVGTLNSAFTYFVAPTVSAVSPTSGSTLGGTRITITGTGFLVGVTVNVDGNPCTSVTRNSATSVSCTTPAGTAGAVDIQVNNTDGGSVIRPASFTYLVLPTIASVSPVGGATSGGTQLTLTGTGFVAGASVTIGGAACTSVVVVSSTSITCVTPSGTVGAKNVVVTNTDTGSATRPNSFSYVVAPSITSVTPGSGPIAGGTAITIIGTGFNVNPTITIAGIACTTIVRVSATELSCVTPAGAVGAADVLVINTNLGSATLVGGFSYASDTASVFSGPSLSGYSAFCVAQGGGSLVLSGSKLNLINSASVDGKAVALSGVTESTIRLGIPALGAGTYSIEYTYSGGKLRHQNAIRVCPEILAPASATVQLTKRFSSFVGDRVAVTPRDLSAITRFISANPGVVEVTCIGSTSGVPAKSSDTALARSRAENACRIVSNLVPGVKLNLATSVGKGNGQFFRAVTIAIRVKRSL